jgi:hypothetical protein
LCYGKEKMEKREGQSRRLQIGLMFSHNGLPRNVSVGYTVWARWENVPWKKETNELAQEERR